MSPRTFSGRECWVYRCQSPSELCGHHPDLIARGLNGRSPDYLLYSPLRETDRGPFDLHGQAGSHAVAITKDALVVSRDPHRSDAGPTVRSIPLANILTVALGEALTLGWLAIRFAEARDVKSEIIFFNSTGIGHFRDLVRLWIRRQHGKAPRAGCGINDHVRLNECHAYLAGQVMPLIADLDGIEMINLPEAWALVDGKPRCWSSSTSLALSDSLVLLAESERPLQPKMLVFGVNATCIPRHALTQVSLQLPDDPDDAVATLTMTVAAAGIDDRICRDLSMSSEIARHVMARLSPPESHERGVA